MRVISFALTLLLGIFVASLFKTAESTTPCSNLQERDFGSVSIRSTTVSHSFKNFDVSRNYSLEEATALVGKKVRNSSALSAKCPKEAGDCRNLRIGEIGEIIGILPSIQNTFLIEIQWDERLEDGFQHSGRFITRAGKEITFEILK